MERSPQGSLGISVRSAPLLLDRQKKEGASDGEADSFSSCSPGPLVVRLNGFSRSAGVGAGPAEQRLHPVERDQLLQPGDLILAVNGRPVTNFDSALQLIKASNPLFLRMLQPRLEQRWMVSSWGTRGRAANCTMRLEKKERLCMIRQTDPTS